MCVNRVVAFCTTHSNLVAKLPLERRERLDHELRNLPKLATICNHIDVAHRAISDTTKGAI